MYVFSILFVLSLPDEYRTEILVMAILIYLVFFAYSYEKIIANVDKSVLVFKDAIGIWLATISPFVMINWFWAAVAFVLYLIVKETVNRMKTMNNTGKNKKFEFIKREVLTGFVTSLLLQIIYSGATVLPFVWMYYSEK